MRPISQETCRATRDVAFEESRPARALLGRRGRGARTAPAVIEDPHRPTEAACGSCCCPARTSRPQH